MNNKDYDRYYFRITQISTLVEYCLEALSRLNKDIGDDKLTDLYDKLDKMLSDELWKLESDFYSKCSDEYKLYVDKKYKEYADNAEDCPLDDYIDYGVFMRRRIGNQSPFKTLKEINK